MWKRESSRLGIFILLGMVLLLAIGLFQIFRIRLVSGEFYPQWSSLRSEPDGTRVLFDSLAATGRFVTARKYRELAQESEPNTTVLYLGLAPAALVRASNQDIDEFEKAARAGDRLVLALDPGRWLTPPKEEASSPLAKRWGVAVDRLPDNGDSIALFFSQAAGWAKDEVVNGRLVIIERAFGPGSIVIAASSGMFSNQSLAASRNSALLLQIIGANTRVVFDESHLGVQDTGSVLGLVHKYRLDGMLWGLLAVATVYVWGHTAGFPPPQTAPSKTTIGHDARSGLAQLLRKQIPGSRLIQACIFEWERSHAGARLPEPQTSDDALVSYRALQQELTHR